jgi:hypothetical protein
MSGFTKKNEKNVTFAKGGNTKMFGPQDAGPQDDATTAHDVNGDGGKFAKGGSTKMFGYAGSQPAEAGKTSAR